MNKLITHNDLLRYVYGETTSVENVRIERALAMDWLLQEQYDELCRMKDVFNRVKRSTPHPSSIRLIMEYSGKTTELETETHY